jgi:hypothetical protein
MGNRPSNKLPPMPRRGLLKGILPFLWTFVPLYLVEKVADYYYFRHDPFFFTVSGMRLELFIVTALAGGVAAGAFIEDELAAFIPQALGVAAAFALLFYACDPRVCFSAGLDGLEPARFGAFLAAVCVSGGALGRGARGLAAMRRRWALMVAFSAFFAAAYYPVMFTFAGTRLLGALHPLPVLAACALAAYAVAVPTGAEFGPRWGLLVPVLGVGALIAASVGIAAAYVGDVASGAAAVALGTLAGAGAGVATSTWEGGRAGSNRRAASGALGLSLVLVLLMTTVVLPDAVSGVAPAPGPQPGSRFSMAVPVYAGAYMDSPPGHAEGAGVTVSFGRTNASSIQADNFLSGGIGIHAAGCCVDGIDYAYRFDIYLFHGGEESLVASGWEACDDNAACGGHSWKALIYLHSAPFAQEREDQNVTLRVQWENRSVVWSYSSPGAGSSDFASFAAPPAENPTFNTGLIPGGSLSGMQPASYFFQFGMMSRYPVGGPGWSVQLDCPSLLINGSWNCVSHAKTLGGQESYWKVIWRWGESYPDVGISKVGGTSATFDYSSPGTGSYLSLW